MNTVRDEVLASLGSDPRAQVLHEFLRAKAQVYVVAGALRDAIACDLGYRQLAARDFDIAIANIGRELFDEVLQSFGQQNRHGGYVLSRPGNPNWDVWRLEESIGLKKTGAGCSLETVLRTFNLDSNAVALDLRTGLLLDAGVVNAVRRRQVGFVEGAIPHSHETFAAKALLLSLRLSYSLSGEMNSFIAQHLENSSLLHEARKVFPGLIVLPPPTRD